MMGRKMMCASLAVVGSLAVGVTDAEAAFTTINPEFTSEQSHQDILRRTYGGKFTADGLNFTNGSITAERIDDDFDEFYEAGQYTATTKGVFAKFGQTLGYMEGTKGKDNFTELFEVEGKRYDAVGQASFSVGTTFRIVRDGEAGLSSSRAKDNRGDADKVVTYLITGAGIDHPTWLVFFEDVKGANADDDFQDLVIELVRTDANIIPTPAAFGAGLAMMSAFALRRRKA